MIKSKLKEKNSARAVTAKRSPKIEQVPEFVSLLRDSWHEEVSRLESRQFSSLEEVVDHFVAIVASRMGNIPDIQARKDFLRDLFLQDEMLCCELSSLFSVSRKE